jgi:uncharacterized protein YjaG (DUF416 family)
MQPYKYKVIFRMFRMLTNSCFVLIMEEKFYVWKNRENFPGKLEKILGLVVSKKNWQSWVTLTALDGLLPLQKLLYGKLLNCHFQT